MHGDYMKYIYVNCSEYMEYVCSVQAILAIYLLRNLLVTKLLFIHYVIITSI